MDTGDIGGYMLCFSYGFNNSRSCSATILATPSLAVILELSTTLPVISRMFVGVVVIMMASLNQLRPQSYLYILYVRVFLL